MSVKRNIFQVYSIAILILSNAIANPVHFWPFYGNADGAVSINATLTSDRFNNPDYAYQFDGATSYIEYADDPSLDITGQISIETWIYLDSTTSNTNHTLLVKAESTSNVEVPNTYSLGTAGDSTYRFCVGGQEILFGNVTFNEWAHLAVTFSHEMQRAKCYVNNELAFNRPALLFDIQASDYPLLVGADADHDKNWNGIIDDIRLFDRMISEAEIDSLFNLPFGINLVTIPSSDINFREVYIGYPETAYVEIRNYGLGPDILNIQDVTFSHPMFENSFVPTNLASGETSRFNVVCNPTDNFRFTESLSIISNDSIPPPHEIQLLGQSLNPPAIVVAPSIISDTLYTGGVSSHVLTIDNTTGVGILGWTSKLLDSLGNSEIYFSKGDSADWTLAENQDRITDNVWLSKTWIQGLINAYSETEYTPTSPEGMSWRIGHLPHDEWEYGAFPTGDPLFIIDTVIACRLEDDEKYLEFRFESWSLDGGGVSYRRDLIIPSWIEYEPIYETMWIHDSYTQTVTLDANGLTGGEYRAGIEVFSNDPASPSTVIPILLNVIEAPDILTEVSLVDFSNAFIGISDTIEVEVKNNGYGDLIISSVDLPGEDIIISPESATIGQDLSEIFKIVFDPQSEGDQSGEILFHTNDPDELEYAVPCNAAGYYPPNISVTIDEIILEQSQPNTIEYSFSIENTGGSDLTVELFPINFIEESLGNHHNTERYEPGIFWGPTYIDASEEEVLLDLQSLTVGLRDDEILFHISGYDHFNLGSILFFIDSDADAGTGLTSPWNLGIEYFLEYNVDQYSLLDDESNIVNNFELSTWEYEPYSNDLLIGVNSSALGNTRGWNCIATSIWGVGAGSDLLPDSGLGYVHIPHKANWVQFESSSDTISPGQIAEIEMSIETSDIPIGSNQAQLHIRSNDPEMRDLIIPINIDVLVGVDDHAELPTEFALKQNYPNPFNPSTTIQYDLPNTTDLTIAVYDLLGRSIWTYEASAQLTGSYSLQWDGLDNSGNLVASGVYLISLSTPEFRAVQKAVLIR